MGDNQFKSVVPVSATFHYVITIRVTNGSITEDTSEHTISKGNTESNAFTVTRTAATTDAVTAVIETLPSLPQRHYGYTLSTSDSLPISIISAVPELLVTPEEIEPPADVDTEPSDGLETTVPTEEIENNPPLFTDGDTTLRVISENTPTARSIGTAVNATDEDGDLLTFSLSGTYASVFLITDAG